MNVNWMKCKKGGGLWGLQASHWDTRRAKPGLDSYARNAPDMKLAVRIFPISGILEKPVKRRTKAFGTDKAYAVKVGRIWTCEGTLPSAKK